MDSVGTITPGHVTAGDESGVWSQLKDLNLPSEEEGSPQIQRKSVSRGLFGGESSEDPSSLDTSLEEEENKKQSPPTPILSPVRKALKVIANANFDQSPCKREKGDLNQAAEAMEDSSPSTLKGQVAKVQEAFVDYVRRSKGVIEPSGDVAVMAISHMDEVVGSTIFRFMARVQEACEEDSQLVIVINLDHLTKPTVEKKRGSGFHFCPTGSPFESIFVSERVVNPATLVWVCEWEYEGVRKTSSFFPKAIVSTHHLMWLLSQSEEILSQDSKAVLKIPAVRHLEHPEWGELPRDFFVEVYKRNAGTVYWSIFPLFYYANYRPKATFRIMQDLMLQAEEIISLLQSCDFKPSYEKSCVIVVDLAPVLKGSPVSQGIFICFADAYKALLKKGKTVV